MDTMSKRKANACILALQASTGNYRDREGFTIPSCPSHEAKPYSSGFDSNQAESAQVSGRPEFKTQRSVGEDSVDSLLGSTSAQTSDSDEEEEPAELTSLTSTSCKTSRAFVRVVRRSSEDQRNRFQHGTVLNQQPVFTKFPALTYEEDTEAKRKRMPVSVSDMPRQFSFSSLSSGVYSDDSDDENDDVDDDDDDDDDGDKEVRGLEKPRTSHPILKFSMKRKKKLTPFKGTIHQVGYLYF